MTKYVAFLRGINVGGRIVKMADLKACFEALGYKEVLTLLQTGNVRFETNQTNPPHLKQQIEAALTERFKYPAKVQVLDIESLHNIIAAYPFGRAGDAQHDYVIFLENGLEQAILTEEYALSPGEHVATGYGVVYWRVNKGATLKSSFAKLLTKAKYRTFNTNRNLKTLQKLVAD